MNKLGYVKWTKKEYMRGFHENIWIGWEIALIDQQSSNLEVGIEYYGLGPIHTWAKSCVLEIVRAQNKCLKVVPRHFQTHVQ